MDWLWYYHKTNFILTDIIFSLSKIITEFQTKISDILYLLRKILAVKH